MQSSIDHVVCPHCMLLKFISASPLSDHPLNTSNHRPVCTVLLSSLPHPQSSSSISISSSHFSAAPNWNGTSKEDIHHLYTKTPWDLSYMICHHCLPFCLLTDQHLHTPSSVLLSNPSEVVFSSSVARVGFHSKISLQWKRT